jgi:capsid protein
MSNSGYTVRDRRSSSALLDGRGRPAVARSAPSRRAWDGAGWSGSQFSRERSFLPGGIADARTELTEFTRTELMRKARWFKKNVGMVRGVAKSIVDLSVGDGIFRIPTTRDDAWNEQAWEWFVQWSKIGDVSARLTFGESQRMRVWHKFWDGELYTLNVQAKTGWPMFQLIRAHNCGNFEVSADQGWHEGIKLGDALRPEAYRFRLKGDRFVTVPASQITHSYMLEDCDGVHGMTALQYCCNEIHDIVDMLLLEKGSAKDNARVSRVIKTESGEDEEGNSNHFDDDDDTDATDADDRGLPLEKVFGNEIVRLRTGESLESFASAKPSPSFTGFLDYIGRGVTAGAGFPYEYSWNPAGINSGAMRAVLDKVKSAIVDWRSNEIQDSIPVANFALARAMELGDLPFHPQWYQAEWIGGAPDPTIDKGRDGREDRENIKAALDTFKLYWARQGKWWKTMLEQKGIEAAYIDEVAKKYGVSPDRIHQLAVNNSGQEGPPAGGPAREDDEQKPGA